MMYVFAIRHKPSGNYLPQLTTRNGGSWLEPTPDCVPRLFPKERNATYALAAWLQGHFRYETSTSGPFDIDETELTVVPVKGRNKEDMEIVKLQLIEDTHWI